MTTIKPTVRTATVAATGLLLVLLSWQGARAVQAQNADASGGLPGIVGTWFLSVPLGGPDSLLTGFSTYDHSGTTTQTVSNMFGGPPQPGGVPTLNGTDRGVWRHVPGGFEVMAFRMIFDPVTSEVTRIVRIRSQSHFDGDRNHLAGTYRVAVWLCPTPTTCPDPTSALPDVPEFAPPENTFTSSRVRFP